MGVGLWELPFWPNVFVYLNDWRDLLLHPENTLHFMSCEGWCNVYLYNVRFLDIYQKQALHKYLSNKWMSGSQARGPLLCFSEEWSIDQ